MQTTLLGVAIALILALIAALAGPLLIDWGRFRPAIEAEASRLLGAPVRVTGPIEAAILPTPSMTLRGLEIGPPGGSNQIEARSLGIRFDLGSLMRGEWRASELHLAGPDFHLGFDSRGQLALPKLAAGFDPDKLSIERLNIEDGHAVLSDARNGSRLVLEKLWFNGDVRSLAGPFKGDGAFVIAGELYAYRVAAGRAGDDGSLKLRVNVDPLDHPLEVDADGTLSFERGAPRFEGSLNLVRPAGVALASGQTLASDPWRVSSRVKATAASALFEEIEFHHGPEERAIKLTGTAELKFGGKPRLDGVLSARQIDLDRVFAAPDATRLLPAAAVKALGESFSSTLRPTIPARLGISVDILTLSGGTVHALRGDLTTDGSAWNLEGFEFRIPGFTQINMSGRLDVSGKRLAFTGPVSVDSSDPSGLVAWLDGAATSSTSRMKPLRARGEVTLGGEKLAIDRLKAEIDRKTMEGRLAYVWAAGGQPARLDADVTAVELDIDALLAFADAARAGTTFETPREVTLGIAVGRAQVAGFEARQVSAQLRRDAKGLQVNRFSVADFGGTAVEASGHIDTYAPSPRGTMKMRLDARSLAGVAALADKFAPDAAAPLRRLADRLPATRLNTTLTLQDAGANTVAKLAVEGQSGAVRLSVSAEGSRKSADVADGNLQALAAADVKLQGRFEADKGAAIVDLLDLGKIVAADANRPGLLTLVADGPLGGNLNVEARLVAGGLDASANGTLRLGGEEPKADLRLIVAAADARPLRHASQPDPLPVTLNGDLAIAGQSLTLKDFSGTVAGNGVRGRIDLVFDQPMRVEGRIETDAVDVPAVIAAATGMPTAAKGRTDGWAWSLEPFGQGLFEEADGRIEFKASRATFGPALVLRQAQGMIRFRRSEIAITDVTGNLADGQAAGQLTFTKNHEGVSANGRLRLVNADAASLLAKAGQPVGGRLTVQIDAEGTGLSPAALIGSLAGNGTVSLARGHLTGFNAQAFDAATQAVDRGMIPDTGKIGQVVGDAFEKGRLAVASAEGVITLAAGQVRLTNMIIQAEGAELALGGSVDLLEGDLNARFALSASEPAPGAAVARPVVFVSLKGPVSDAKRTVDVSALTAWLALRAVEQQSKRIEALEAKRQPPPEKMPAEDTQTPIAAPSAEQAPPLPPPVEIRTIPGLSDQKPVRTPAAVQNGTSGAAKPGSEKQVLPPPTRLTPPDLSASRNN